MRRLLAVFACAVCLLLLLHTHVFHVSPTLPPVLAAGHEPPPPPAACNFPNHEAATPEQTAWELFVASMCPTGGSGYPYVVFENWQQQTQVYPASGVAAATAFAEVKTPAARFHVSVQNKLRQRALGRELTAQAVPTTPEGDCNHAQAPHQTVILCEEVRINPVMVRWLDQGKLNVRPGQIMAAVRHLDIEMPPPSIEIKADWVQLPSCSPILSGIHIERFNNTCYALAGMHLISKLVNKWVWATFEPQVPVTNPDRCKVLGCSDAFGSLPAATHGVKTSQTPALIAMMKQAGLAPEWFNYRLDGVQIDYLDSAGKPSLLGNSVIEGENAGVPLTQSSCISCHAVSSVNTKGVNGISLLTSNPVGTPKALPDRTWIRRDFLWSALLASCPANGPTPDCPFPAHALGIMPGDLPPRK